MNELDNIQSILNRLKDRCINDIDLNFNLYLLNDISEVGEVRELFTSQDWYLYYLECAWELNPLIDRLLNEDEQNKERLIEAIKLKRIIDERLMFFNSDSESILEDLGFNSKTVEVISLTDKILDANSFLQNLHKQLMEKRWIDSNLQVWLSNFLDSDNHISINWIGRLYQLVGVIKYLSDERYIKQVENPTQFIKYHFVRKSKLIIDSSIPVYFSNALISQDNPKKNYLFIDSCNEQL